MANLRKRLRRLGAWDWAALTLALWAVFVPVAWIVGVAVFPGLIPGWAWGIAELPVFGLVVASLWLVGISSERRELIARTTLLWSWLGFLGASTRSGASLIAGVVAGAVIAIVAGDGANLDALRTAAYILIIAFCGWLLLIVFIWTIRAAIDVSGRRPELEENLLTWLQSRRVKRARELSEILGDGASIYFVVMCSLGLALVVLTALYWAGRMLGF